MHCIRKVLLLLFFIFYSCRILGQPTIPIVIKYYCAKPNDGLKFIQNMPEMNWQSNYSVKTTFGYTWIRLKFNNKSPETVWMEIQSHFIDSLEIWVKSKDSLVEHYEFDNHFLDTLISPVRHHYFLIPIKNTNKSTVFIKGFATPPEPLKLPIVIRSPNNFLLYYQKDIWIWAWFTGMASMAIIISVISYLFHPLKVYIFYAGYIFFIATYAMLNDGWGVFLHTKLKYFDDSIFIGHCINIAIGFFLLFSKSFLEINSEKLWLKLNPFAITFIMELLLLFIQYIDRSSTKFEYVFFYNIGFFSFLLYFTIWVIYVFDSIKRKYSPVWLHIASVAIMAFF